MGTFQNNKFIKGKIYSYDNGSEQLKFKDEDIKNDNGKKVINIEKNDNLTTFTEGILKDKILIEGIALTINDNEQVENQFSYKINKELKYDYDYLDDEKKKEELMKQLNEMEFNKYRNNIQEMYEKIITIFEKTKGDFNYAKDLSREENLKKNFIEYLKKI